MNLDPFIGVILVWAILSLPVGVILGRRLKQAQPKQATKRETV